MEIDIDIRKFKLHILFITVVTSLGVGFYSWRKYRWDEPWLKPDSKQSILAIRFEAIDCSDPRFKRLKVECVNVANRWAIASGIQAGDLEWDSREWPTRYAWIQLLSTRWFNDHNSLRKFKADVSKAIASAGIKVDWRIAFVGPDGTVIYPE